jgi:quinoprotein glucose dehydrogenase
MNRPALHSLLLAAPLLAPVAAQDPIPVQLTDAFPAQAKFDRPVYLDHHPADPGRYWVVEQTGRIFRIPADGSSAERQLVLDWSEIALHPSNGGHNEEGLLGFAFAPGFGDANQHVFVYYSHRKGGEGRGIEREGVVSRLTVRDQDGELRIDPESELPVLRVDQPWGNHNGGTVLFGPDRMLYVALGDGGAADDRGGNGQNLGTLLAAILRIDVSAASVDAPYRVPADNPFVDREGARPEIWAYGLRNPWRISFDRETGDLWCADVGQNLWEEVDRIVKGGNYGWPIMEGTHDFPAGAARSAEEKAGMIAPVAEYPHKEGVSVTGGFVYRGRAIPALRGRYVYGDFAFMSLWAVREDRAGGAHEVAPLGRAKAPIAAFAEEPDGEHLLLCFDGRIYRIVPADG